MKIGKSQFYRPKLEISIVIKRNANNQRGFMSTQNIHLKIITSEFEVKTVCLTEQFINIEGVKIETTQSFLNRNGAIIYLPLKTKKSRTVKSPFLFHFQKAA